MKKFLSTIIFLTSLLFVGFSFHPIFKSQSEDKAIADNTKTPGLFTPQEKIVNGRYISREDSLAGIEIKGKKLIMFHKSTEITASDYFDFKITDTITNHGKLLDNGRFLTLSNKEMTLKYAIDYWDEEMITLIYLPRGNFHHYFREK